MPLVLVPIAVAVGAIAFLFLTWLTQRSLLYFPGAGPVPSASSALSGASDLELRTDDGLRLGAWFVPASTKASGVTVIVFNGNAGDRSLRAGLARGLAATGHAVLLFDYRGFGGNPGTPTETGLRADARAALDHIASRPGVDPARIVYFGESLGAAVAGGLAADRAPFALILRSPFPSLADVGRVHYPYLPVTDALLMDTYRVSDALAAVRAPILVVGGDGDRIVPIGLSRRVHDDLSGPKRFVVLAGMDHNDPELAEGRTLIGEVARFLDDVAAGVLP
jgi:uncharacterized protein